MPKFHTAYEPPPQVDYFNDEPSLTQQHFADECDINNIVEKYMITGVLGDPLSIPSNSPQYGDYSSPSDYHAAQNLIAQASQAFDLLPARLRERFENDPAKLLEFLGDEKNREEAIKLGLVNNTQSNNESPEPVRVIMVDSKGSSNSDQAAGK